MNTIQIFPLVIAIWIGTSAHVATWEAAFEFQYHKKEPLLKRIFYRGFGTYLAHIAMGPFALWKFLRSLSCW